MARRTPPLLSYLALTFVLASTTGCQQIASEIDAKEDAVARVEYYEQSAQTYYDGGRYEQSAMMWDKVIEERPEDQWAMFGLAKALHMQGSPPALRRAQAILSEIVCLCWIHPERGDVRFEVLTTLANVYSSRADLYSRDMRILQARLANDPNANSVELAKQIKTQKGKRDEFLQLSIPAWGEVLAQSPDNPYGLAGLAKAHLMAGTEEAGIRYALRYVGLSRQSQVRWRQQMENWDERTGGEMTRDQRVFFRDRIQGAKEKELGVRLLLGSTYMRRDQFQYAIQQYDQVLALDPALPAGYVERGQAYAAMGMYPQAVADLEQYLQMTDPQRQRMARVNAADLLDRYRKMAEARQRGPRPRAVPRGRTTYQGGTPGRVTYPSRTPGRVVYPQASPGRVVCPPSATAQGSPDARSAPRRVVNPPSPTASGNPDG